MLILFCILKLVGGSSFEVTVVNESEILLSTTVYD